VPVSKRRKKKRTRSVSPPVSKETLVTRKTGKLSRQRLALYIISALVVLAMAVGVIVSAFAPAPVTQGAPTTETPIAEPAADEQATPAEKESTAEATVESSSATEEPNAEN
jgi:cytoskeletal protein RodZ